MSIIENTTNQDGLEDLIDSAQSSLKGMEEGSDEYTATLKQLTELYKIRDAVVSANLKAAEIEVSRFKAETERNQSYYERDNKIEETALKVRELEAPKTVSPDTWVIAGANIAGILAIIGYERFNVVTSKALSMLFKTR